MLSCFGSRCWTSTKAIPVSVGRAFRSSVNASRPPAEAPTPTIGNPSGRGSGSVTASAAGAATPAEALKPSLTDLLLTVLELRGFPRIWLAGFALSTGRIVVFLAIHPHYAAFVSGSKKVFHTIALFPPPGQARRQPLNANCGFEAQATPPADAARAAYDHMPNANASP